MKRYFLAVAILLGVSLVAMVVVQGVTDAQRPPMRGQGEGPPRAGMRFGPQAMIRGMSFDRTWMAFSFELDTTDEQLVEARTVYRRTWEDLKAYGEQTRQRMQDAGGPPSREERQEIFQEMRNKARQVQSALDASLKEILREEQFQQLMEIRREDQQRMQEQMRSNRGRRGPGPGGGAQR